MPSSLPRVTVVVVDSFLSSKSLRGQTLICAFSSYLHSWPSYIYDAIRDWHIARGFNPTTPGFARHMECPKLEAIRKESTEVEQFEFVDAEAGGALNPFYLHLPELGNTDAEWENEWQLVE
ncbi:hypothetical protein WG66_008033 [Moniliophthora roreri]|nr:hypothetical protein WG66_008033 [Moniliophthora roreri]